MRSLYATIVTSSVVIVLLSFAVGLLTANLAYGHTLNLHYEEKMRDIGRSITFFATESPRTSSPPIWSISPGWGTSSICSTRTGKRPRSAAPSRMPPARGSRAARA